MNRSTVDDRIGVAVLGSTGSVGQQTLAVIDALNDRFRVVALAARSPSPRLIDQIEQNRPEIVALTKASDSSLIGESRILTGPESLTAAATYPAVDIVVVATSGHAAIVPTMRAIEGGKIVALANKEVLVCAGELLMPLAAAKNTIIRPVDSEHSAIWQALAGSSIDQVRRIIITASGGPFRETPKEAFAAITARDALAHPTWSMGGKITVDSATLMNKGLEVIEAHWLFGLPYERIDVLVHPQSIVHSLVEFVDGGLMAQLGLPDMKLPIQFALTYPDRIPASSARLDMATTAALQFEHPDESRFPALRLAREAGIAGQTYPTVLSAADDEAVAAFFTGSLRFVDIPHVVASVIDAHEPIAVSLESIVEADAWARRTARSLIAERTNNWRGLQFPAKRCGVD
jgi:1-deoxy-D-xylulose-5-phosphate reductoisomerase